MICSVLDMFSPELKTLRDETSATDNASDSHVAVAKCYDTIRYDSRD